ncbi:MULTISPECIES: hypothetical protein [Nocardia]|uniref:hypothetical protein n=1 Tax=Nocardia TaxID=1817 RepID=UPI0024580528|nr:MULTISPECIES: hypothetical protein [Nocardia]
MAATDHEDSLPVRRHVNDTAHATETARVLALAPMAAGHLRSARYFNAQCRDREAALVSAGKLGLDSRHRALAIGTVFAAVAFLEAYVNEVREGAVFQHQGSPMDLSWLIGGISDAGVAALASAEWVTEDRALGLPHKFQRALKCVGKQRFAENDEPFLSASLLIQLRNALVHSTPEIRDLAEPSVLQTELQRRFAPSQLGGDPWYPHRCLGAGLTQWACQCSVEFAEAWRARMGVAYDPVADADRDEQ